MEKGLKKIYTHEKVKVSVAQSCPNQAPLPMEFSRQEYWSGYHSLLQGIFPTQGLNPGLPHCRQILYQLSHKESPRILEWTIKKLSTGELMFLNCDVGEDS